MVGLAVLTQTCCPVYGLSLPPFHFSPSVGMAHYLFQLGTHDDATEGNEFEMLIASVGKNLQRGHWKRLMARVCERMADSPPCLK